MVARFVFSPLSPYHYSLDERQTLSFVFQFLSLFLVTVAPLCLCIPTWVCIWIQAPIAVAPKWWCDATPKIPLPHPQPKADGRDLTYQPNLTQKDLSWRYAWLTLVKCVWERSRWECIFWLPGDRGSSRPTNGIAYGA